jgi:putative glutathione S-transferase
MHSSNCAAGLCAACDSAAPPPLLLLLLQVPDTVDVDGCRRSYYSSLFPLNPSGIIPSGPTAADLQLDLPANRGSHEPREVFYMKAAAAAAAEAAAAAKAAA